MSKQKFVQKNILPKQSESKKKKQEKKAKESATGSANKQKQGIFFAALAVISFLVFFPSLKCEFTNWDDGTYVTQNPMIWKLDAKNVKVIFTTPVSLNYHPLTMLSLAIDYMLGKLNPYYYHLHNLLIHTLNALLLFGFVQKLTRRYNQSIPSEDFHPNAFRVACITSAFWLIHPMRVESVTWVAERKDVLYLFFFLLALIFYLRWLDSKKNATLIFCFLFFLCSCLSKGMGVVFPVVLVLVDWFCGGVRTGKQLYGSIMRKWYLFLTSLVFGIIAFKIQNQGAIAAMGTFTFFQRLTFGCYGFISYIYKLFVPINLSAFYPYPFTDVQGNIPAIYYSSPFIVLGMLATVVFICRKNKEAGKILTFGFLFYLVTVALVLQFISVGSVIIADRYSYLSYVGLLFMVGYFFEFARYKMPKRLTIIFTAFLIAVAVLFSYLAHRRTKVWTNAETLWTDAMHQFPFIEIAYENRGIYYKDHNQLDKMLKDYEIATQQLHSRNEKIWANLGNLYGLLKQFDKSLSAYSVAIEINPLNASSYLNRAITYSMMGEYAKALPDFDRSLEIDSQLFLVYKNRAYTLMQLGQFEKSVNDYDKALELYSYDTLSYLNRGIAKFNAKKYQPALTDFKKYISLNPNNSQAYYNASITSNNLNLFADALLYARQSQKLGQSISIEYLKELEAKTQGK